jgi:hypothetical protein
MQDLLDKFPALQEDVAALRRASVNIAIKGVRLDSGRLIREKLAITKTKGSSKTPKTIVESRIKLKFAKKEDQSGKLVITDSKIPIRWFSPKQTPKTQKGRKTPKIKAAKKKPFRFKMLRSKDMIKSARKTGLKLVKQAKQFNPFKKKKKKKKTIKGTTAKILKSGSRVLYPHAFGPNTEKLGFTIWERKGRARYPLTSPYGVDVAQVIRSTGGERRLRASAKLRLEKEVNRRIKRLKYIKPRRGKKAK